MSRFRRFTYSYSMICYIQNDVKTPSSKCLRHRTLGKVIKEMTIYRNCYGTANIVTSILVYLYQEKITTGIWGSC